MKSKIISQETAPSKPVYPRLWKKSVEDSHSIIYMETKSHAICIHDGTESGALGHIITGDNAHEWSGWTQITGPVTIQFNP